MSVVTKFDEKQEELKNHLTTSIRVLHEMLDEDIWGHSEVKAEFIADLSLMRVELRKMRDKL